MPSNTAWPWGCHFSLPWPHHPLALSRQGSLSLGVPFELLVMSDEFECFLIPLFSASFSMLSLLQGVGILPCPPVRLQGTSRLMTLTSLGRCGFTDGPCSFWTQFYSSYIAFQVEPRLSFCSWYTLSKMLLYGTQTLQFYEISQCPICFSEKSWILIWVWAVAHKLSCLTIFLWYQLSNVMSSSHKEGVLTF